MRTIRLAVFIGLGLAASLVNVYAQETVEAELPDQVITQEGYDRSAPAIVKLVADEGKKIGAGAVVAVHQDGVGFILTSYRMIGGRNKVAVILRDYPDPLLGYAVDRWIDFDTDVAIIAVKNFPENQPVICLQEHKDYGVGDTFTLIGHTDLDDWMPIPSKLQLTEMDHLIFTPVDYRGLEGTPVLNEDGHMVGLVVSTEAGEGEQASVAQALKVSAVKPLVKGWFTDIRLSQKWCEKGTGLATWVWAVGGTLLGGGIAAAVVVAGGDVDNIRPLPRPPAPPNTQ